MGKKKHLKISHWDNGWIHIVSHDHKWDEIMLDVPEQRELFEYLKLNIEKHENEAEENEKQRLEALRKLEQERKKKPRVN